MLVYQYIFGKQLLIVFVSGVVRGQGYYSVLCQPASPDWRVWIHQWCGEAGPYGCETGSLIAKKSHGHARGFFAHSGGGAGLGGGRMRSTAIGVCRAVDAASHVWQVCKPGSTDRNAIAFELIDELACLGQGEFIRGTDTKSVLQEILKGDATPRGDCPNGADLRAGGRTDIGRDSGGGYRRGLARQCIASGESALAAGSVLVSGGAGQFVLNSMVARGVGATNNLLKVFEILK
jgi:hypothetical protein